MKNQKYYRLPKKYDYKDLCVEFEFPKKNLKFMEEKTIFDCVFKKLNGEKFSIAHKISEKYHIDFIDWNKYENQYVIIICKNKINLK